VPAFEVPAFTDRETCTFVPLRTRRPLDVTEVVIKNRGIGDGFVSHHLVLFAYTGDLPAVAGSARTAVDDTGCINFGAANARELQIVATAQAVESRQPMPRGTALRLEPQPLGRGQAVGFVLNSHWINASSQARRARAQVKLVRARRGAVQRILKPIFEVVANGFINVPPGEERTVGSRWGPGLIDLGSRLPSFAGSPFPEGAACVTMLIGHMHRRGRLFTAEFVDADDTSTPLYANTDYADPPTLALDPPLLVVPGQRITYSCTHDNATDPRLGCEETPGVPPGRDSIETFPSLDGAAKLCAAMGPNPGECPPTDPRYPQRTFTGNCVPARLVFGFTSEDEMCILPGYYYDADPVTGCALSP
jgi:hypothetical protein